MAQDSAAERQPLLAHDAALPSAHAAAHGDDNGSPDATNIAAHPANEDAAPSAYPRATLIRAIVAAILCFVLMDTGGKCVDLAFNALWESSICYNLHPDLRNGTLEDRLADPRCKGEDVQSELAVLKGWFNMWIMVPGLVMAMPYGILADRMGPRFVILLVPIGHGLSWLTQAFVSAQPERFDIHWIFAAVPFWLIGGGGIVLTAMSFTYAGLISSEKHRSTVFLYILAMQYVDSFVTSPVAYVALKFGPLLAIGVGMVAVVLSFVTAFFLPAVQSKPKTRAADEETADEEVTKPGGAWYETAINNATKTLGSTLACFTSNFYGGLLLVGMVFSTLGASEQDLRVQYGAKQFHWTWGEAGLIDTVRSAVTLPMITVVIPSLGYFLMKRFDLNPVAKDLWVARGSAFIMVTGSIAQGLVPTAALFYVSVGYYELSRGYSASIVAVIAGLLSAEHGSMVFVCVTMMQALGMLISGPLLGEVFALGFRMGERWYGLPFLVCASLQAVSLTFAWIVKVKRK